MHETKVSARSAECKCRVEKGGQLERASPLVGKMKCRANKKTRIGESMSDVGLMNIGRDLDHYVTSSAGGAEQARALRGRNSPIHWGSNPAQA